MQFLNLFCLGVIVSEAFCADNGMFLCKKIDTEFDTVIKKTKSQPQPRPTPRAKPRPRPTPRPKAGELNYKVLNGKLEERIRELEERVARLEVMNKLNLEFDLVAAPEPCHVTHRNKCFKFVEKEMGTLNLKESVALCEEENGELANIYDRGLVRKIEGYLREMMTDDDQMEYFITGMTYERDTDTVFLRNGSPAPFVTWYSEFDPSPKPGRTRIHFQVNKEKTTASGMYNVSPLSRAKSALCEISKKYIDDLN